MEITAEIPLESPKIHLSAVKRRFEGEYAREMARKSAEVRAKKRAEAEQAKAIADELRQAAIVVPAQIYVKEQLNRVRGHIQRMDELLQRETDPNKIDRLASALSKLLEQERILDNRPLPGSRRPKAEKADKPSSPSISDEFAPQ